MVAFLTADEMAKFAENYSVRCVEDLAESIQEEISTRALNGKRSVTIDVIDKRDWYDVSLDSLTYIYNQLLQAGYKIEDNNSKWTIRW